MFDPVKAAFGQYMARFYGQLVPTTRAMQEFVVRGVAKSIMWAPARMVDAAEEMLALYQRQESAAGITLPYELPIMFAAMAKDYSPTGRDAARQLADTEWVTLPGDTKGRAFQIRTIAADIRAQVVIAAREEATARSLAAQFSLWLDSVPGRRFPAIYLLAGQQYDWPVVVESPDVAAVQVPTDAKNLTLLAMDVTLRATIPLLGSPRRGEHNDGTGIPETDDPPGHPVVQVITGTEFSAPTYSPDASIGTWKVEA